MNFFMRELLIIGVLVVAAVLISGAWIAQSDKSSEPSFRQLPAADIQELQLTPAVGRELVLITATPTVRRELSTPTSTPIPIQTASARPAFESPTPPPPPQRPAPTADFSGRWR